MPWHMALKEVSYAIFLGPYAIFPVEIPWFEPTSMPHGPPLYGIFLGHIFANMGGGGGLAIRKFWERARKGESSPKWLGEGAKGLLSPGSKSLPRVFCTIRNPFCTGATPFCTGASPFSLPGLKRPFAPSPNHFREFTIFGLSPRTFGRVWKMFSPSQAA